jgi:3-deoxy-manno-octulosonate cytidylyltransferase (CMP-KDO synthetase)
MVVRVAERAALSGAARVVVACDDPRIQQACAAHGVAAVLTRSDHASGSDRLAEACGLLGLADDECVVNVQGDEPLIDPNLVRQCAQLLHEQPGCVMSTAAHPITELADHLNPNVVKVVVDAQRRALYFSRAPIPWWRDGGVQPAAPAVTRPAATRRPIRLSRGLPAPLSAAFACADGTDRSAGTTARAVARRAHRSACG